MSVHLADYLLVLDPFAASVIYLAIAVLTYTIYRLPCSVVDVVGLAVCAAVTVCFMAVYYADLIACLAILLAVVPVSYLDIDIGFDFDIDFAVYVKFHLDVQLVFQLTVAILAVVLID